MKISRAAFRTLSLAACALLIPRAAFAWYVGGYHQRYDPSLKGLALSMLPFCAGLGMVLFIIYTLTTPRKADPNAPLDAESQKLRDGLAALDEAVDAAERSAPAPAAEAADPLVDAPPAPDDASPPPPHRPRGLL